MGYETILYEVADGVATVTLNRPDRMNALNDVIVKELHDAMWRADGHAEARVIVLTGAGARFAPAATSAASARPIQSNWSPSCRAYSTATSAPTIRLGTSISPSCASR